MNTNHKTNKTRHLRNYSNNFVTSSDSKPTYTPRYINTNANNEIYPTNKFIYSIAFVPNINIMACKNKTSSNALTKFPWGLIGGLNGSGGVSNGSVGPIGGGGLNAGWSPNGGIGPTGASGPTGTSGPNGPYIGTDGDHGTVNDIRSVVSNSHRGIQSNNVGGSGGNGIQVSGVNSLKGNQNGNSTSSIVGGGASGTGGIGNALGGVGIGNALGSANVRVNVITKGGNGGNGGGIIEGHAGNTITNTTNNNNNNTIGTTNGLIKHNMKENKRLIIATVDKQTNNYDYIRLLEKQLEFIKAKHDNMQKTQVNCYGSCGQINKHDSNVVKPSSISPRNTIFSRKNTQFQGIMTSRGSPPSSLTTRRVASISNPMEYYPSRSKSIVNTEATMKNFLKNRPRLSPDMFVAQYSAKANHDMEYKEKIKEKRIEIERLSHKVKKKESKRFFTKSEVLSTCNTIQQAARIGLPKIHMVSLNERRRGPIKFDYSIEQSNFSPNEHGDDTMEAFEKIAMTRTPTSMGPRINSLNFPLTSRKSMFESLLTMPIMHSMPIEHNNMMYLDDRRYETLRFKFPEKNDNDNNQNNNGDNNKIGDIFIESDNSMSNLIKEVQDNNNNNNNNSKPTNTEAKPIQSKGEYLSYGSFCLEMNGGDLGIGSTNGIGGIGASGGVGTGDGGRGNAGGTNGGEGNGYGDKYDQEKMCIDTELVLNSSYGFDGNFNNTNSYYQYYYNKNLRPIKMSKIIDMTKKSNLFFE